MKHKDLVEKLHIQDRYKTPENAVNSKVITTQKSKKEYFLGKMKGIAAGTMLFLSGSNIFPAYAMNHPSPQQNSGSRIVRQAEFNAIRGNSFNNLFSQISETSGLENAVAQAIQTPSETQVPIDPFKEIKLADRFDNSDIYDDDDIKIVLPSGLKIEDISAVKVYRNGIYQPWINGLVAAGLILTNAQMKTFKGLSAENSPASSHTDHAIMGYEYRFLIYDINNQLKATLNTTIKSTVKWQPEKRYVHLSTIWPWDVNYNYLSKDQIVNFFKELKNDGFNGISVSIEYYMDRYNSTNVFSMNVREDNPWTSKWSATESELDFILSCINEAQMESEVRLVINLNSNTQNPNCLWGTCISPTNINTWFNNYRILVEDLVKFLEKYHVNEITPFTEMDSIEKYTQQIQEFYTKLDPFFSGKFAFEEATQHFFWDGEVYESEQSFLNNVGKFWNWSDTQGNYLKVQWSIWNVPVDLQADQRYSVMLNNFLSFFSMAYKYYNSNYPNNKRVAGEMGGFPQRDVADGKISWSYPPTKTRDDQALAEVLSTYLLGLKQMNFEGFTLWDIRLCNVQSMAPNAFWITTDSVVYKTVSAIIKSN